jgi:hypothetical protein
MSADNFVVVRRFGKYDYRWGNFSASAVYEWYKDSQFQHGPFSTEEDAIRDAETALCIIEYGFCDDILPPGRPPWQDEPELIDKDKALAVKQKIADELRQQVKELREENRQLRVDFDNLDQAFLNNERLYRGQSVEYDKTLTELDNSFSDLSSALSDLDKLRKLAKSLHTRLEIEVSGHFDPAQDPLLNEAKEALEKLDKEY